MTVDTAGASLPDIEQVWSPSQTDKTGLLLVRMRLHQIIHECSKEMRAITAELRVTQCWTVRETLQRRGGEVERRRAQAVDTIAFLCREWGEPLLVECSAFALYRGASTDRIKAGEVVKLLSLSPTRVRVRGEGGEAWVGRGELTPL